MYCFYFTEKEAEIQEGINNLLVVKLLISGEARIRTHVI